MKNVSWWTESGDGTNHALWACISHIKNTYSWRRQAAEYHAELYAGGPGALALRSYAGAAEYQAGTLPRNVARAATDTLQALIIQEKPLPEIVTVRGDDAKQKRAQNMTMFLQGMFAKVKVFEHIGPMIVRDAEIFGCGLALVLPQDDEVIVDRVLPTECFVDEYDARDGNPRNFYIVKSIDRGQLKGMFPGNDKDIDNANDSRSEWDLYDTVEASTVDRVHVAMAWHLPDKKGGEGRFIVSIPGKDLQDLPWKRDTLPIAVLRYSEPLAGFWGTGLVEILEGFQYELNTIQTKVSESHHYLGSGWIINQAGSGLTDGMITNGLRQINCPPGLQPQVVLNQPVHPQTYSYMEDLYQGGLNETGVPQSAAQSVKPAGLTSGIAIQTVSEIKSDRFRRFGEGYQAWCLSLAENMTQCAEEIAQEYPDFALNVLESDGLIELKWNEVSMVDDVYHIRILPTSAFSKSLGARMEQVIAMRDMSPQERKLLNMPDTDQADREELAMIELADQQIAHMTGAYDPFDPEVFQYPEPYQDLDYALLKAQRIYCVRRMQKPNKEGEVLEKWLKVQSLLQDYISAVNAEKKKQSAEAAGPIPVAPPAMGLGAPMPMPGMPPDLSTPPNMGVPTMPPPMPTEGAL